MAININDIIMQQVASAAKNVNIPSNVKNQALGGLTEAVLGGLTQTAAKQGGADILKQVLSGKSAGGSADIAAAAAKIFASGAGKGLDGATSKALSAAIPSILGGLSGGIKDMDGDGDVDINDIILALSGAKPATASKGNGGALLGAAAKAVLGSMLKK